MRFLAALQFLTIIPLPGRGVSPEELGRSTPYFPVVGIIIGLILVGLNWLLRLVLPSTIVNGLLIVFLVVISGGLHLDGFLDTCDALAGKTVDERWRVMHDSRAGSFGVIGAFCLLLLKYISLNSLPETLLTTALLLMPTLSRWAMVYAIFAYPLATASILGKVFKPGANRLRFAIATIIALVVALALARLAGLAIIFGIWVIVLVMAAYLKHKFSGLSGDTYGAINEATEVCVLLLFSLLAHWGWD